MRELGVWSTAGSSAVINVGGLEELFKAECGFSKLLCQVILGVG